jgi:hypothetical protein
VSKRGKLGSKLERLVTFQDLIEQKLGLKVNSLVIHHLDFQYNVVHPDYPESLDHQVIFLENIR